jgi:hypothetical protein
MQRPVLLALAAVLALGCQRTPSPPGSEAPTHAPAVASPGARAAAQGDASMQAGDHRVAAERYREAVAAEPDVVSHRFALASAYTFLDRRPEAIEQFRWVLSRAEPTSPEHREARRWLIGAGVAVESAPTEAASDPTPAADGSASEAPLVGGRLVGSTEWPGIDPKVRAVSGEMSLTGIEGATETIKRFRPLRLGARYHFYNVPPGKYRLVVRMAHHPEDVVLWDQRVLVADGTPTEFNLTPASARLSPDEFPPPVKE